MLKPKIDRWKMWNYIFMMNNSCCKRTKTHFIKPIRESRISYSWTSKTIIVVKSIDTNIGKNKIKIKFLCIKNILIEIIYIQSG